MRSAAALRQQAYRQRQARGRRRYGVELADRVIEQVIAERLSESEAATRQAIEFELSAIIQEYVSLRR